jgi:hypothetical protein
MLYWYKWFSWWWAQGCSKHVENRSKYIFKKRCVKLVIYYNNASIINIRVFYYDDGSSTLHIPGCTKSQSITPQHESSSLWKPLILESDLLLSRCRKVSAILSFSTTIKPQMFALRAIKWRLTQAIKWRLTQAIKWRLTLVIKRRLTHAIHSHVTQSS